MATSEQPPIPPTPVQLAFDRASEAMRRFADIIAVDPPGMQEHRDASELPDKPDAIVLGLALAFAMRRASLENAIGLLDCLAAYHSDCGSRVYGSGDMIIRVHGTSLSNASAPTSEEQYAMLLNIDETSRKFDTERFRTLELRREAQLTAYGEQFQALARALVKAAAGGSVPGPIDPSAKG